MAVSAPLPRSASRQGGQDADADEARLVGGRRAPGLTHGPCQLAASAEKGRPPSSTGWLFTSRLKRFTSSVTRGSIVSASTARLMGRGAPFSSTRSISSSTPSEGGPCPKPGPGQQLRQGGQALPQLVLEAREVRLLEVLLLESPVPSRAAPQPSPEIGAVGGAPTARTAKILPSS